MGFFQESFKRLADQKDQKLLRLKDRDVFPMGGFLHLVADDPSHSRSFSHNNHVDFRRPRRQRAENDSKLNSSFRLFYDFGPLFFDF